MEVEQYLHPGWPPCVAGGDPCSPVDRRQHPANHRGRRLEIVRPAVPIDLAGAVLAESWSNDTWLTSGSVVRRVLAG